MRSERTASTERIRVGAPLAAPAVRILDSARDERGAERRKSRRPRGFTLVELVVSVGVASVLIASTAAVFIATSQSKAAASRKSEAINSSAGTLELIQFDADNAGFHWPALPFAISVSNNYVASPTGGGAGGGGGSGGGDAECGNPGWTRVEGSDAIDFSIGNARSPGKVFQVGAPTAVTPTDDDARFNVTLEDTTPFDVGADDFDAIANPSLTRRALVLFKNESASCIASIDSVNTGSHAIRGNLLSRDFKPISAGLFQPAGNIAWNLVPSGGKACPQKNMDVYRLEERVKYVLCKDPAPAQGMPDIVLVRRSLKAQGGFFTPVAPVTEAGQFGIGNGTVSEVARDGVQMMQVGVKIAVRPAYYTHFHTNYEPAYVAAHANEANPCDGSSCWCNIGVPRCPARRPRHSSAPELMSMLSPTSLSYFQGVPESAGNDEYGPSGNDLTFDGKADAAIGPLPFFAAKRIDDATWPRALKIELVTKKKSDTANPSGLTTLDQTLTAAQMGSGDYSKSAVTIRLKAGFVQ